MTSRVAMGFIARVLRLDPELEINNSTGNSRTSKRLRSYSENMKTQWTA